MIHRAPYQHAHCWICGSASVQKISDGLSANALTSEHFTITDSYYGNILNLYQCTECGFRFCPDAGDVTHYYMQMEDADYERTRISRSTQARKLLRSIRSYQPCGGTLLDIGAGSGILVEQAQKMGYRAQGIEPCHWLVEKAAEQSIPVVQGVFPDAVSDARYHVITLVDVLEHVNTPLTLLKDIARHLEQNGIAIIVTPDAGSLAAKMLGRKWWHCRIAHIGYFEQHTLTLALQQAGLTPLFWQRPTWFFPLSYLLSRLAHYIPYIDNLTKFRVMDRIVIPLNLYDSWLVVVRKTL